MAQQRAGCCWIVPVSQGAEARLSRPGEWGSAYDRPVSQMPRLSKRSGTTKPLRSVRFYGLASCSLVLRDEGAHLYSHRLFPKRSHRSALFDA